jgi:ABC-type uncharacterized transport system ATPase component
VLDNDLKKAKEKSDYYNKLKIEELIERVNKKKDQENELKSLEKQLSLLTSQFSELSYKYNALLSELENELRTFVQSKENEKLFRKNTAMDEEKNLRKLLQQSVDNIRAGNQQAVEQALEAVDQQKQLLLHEQLKKEALRHKRFLKLSRQKRHKQSVI